MFLVPSLCPYYAAKFTPRTTTIELTPHQPFETSSDVKVVSLIRVRYLQVYSWPHQARGSQINSIFLAPYSQVV